MVEKPQSQSQLQPQPQPQPQTQTQTQTQIFKNLLRKFLKILSYNLTKLNF